MSKRSRNKGPEVSIVILNWNKSALTLKCLESIRHNTVSNSYETLVVDNGSEPAELAQLKQGLDKSTILMSLERNMFFGGGCNIGAKAARGEFLLFLNNDVFITPGAIDGLIARYQSSFSPGAVGPKFLYPNGVLQEAGAFVLQNGWTFQQGKAGTQPDRHFAHGAHIVDYCSAACLLIERKIFMQHGGFDTVFEPAYFEDVDLCFRLRKKGLYTYYDSDVCVYHAESLTSVTIWSPEKIAAINATNHDKFMQRWTGYLESRLQELRIPLQDESTEPDVQSSDSAHFGTILVRSAVPLGESRYCDAILQCAAALETKYEVTLAAPEISDAVRLDTLCSKLGLHLRKCKAVELNDVDSSLYDQTISFPDAASEKDALRSNLNCMRMLFDTL